MKDRILTPLRWAGTVFFGLGALVFIPSIASIFLVLLAILLVPLPFMQKPIRRFLKATWQRVVAGVLIFLVAMNLIPQEPAAPEQTPQVSIETTIPQTETTSVITRPVEETTLAPIEETTQAPTEETTVPPTTEPIPSSFEIHFIDVGQADAALVLCDGEAMLIDGGNAEDSSRMYTYLKKQAVDHLDYVIGTHAHEDHIGGIAGALNYASVDTVYCPVTSYDSKAFQNFVKAVEKHGTSVTVPTNNTAFTLGSAYCDVLAVNTDDDTNNSSIVLRITYGSTAFLFAADAEHEVENAILDRNETVSSTVLKVGHHGADTSTSYRWLRQVMPQYAVISVGAKNSYGHPTEEVLSRLRDAQVTTFRTDLQGDLICVSDGTTVTITPTRNADADVFGGMEENSTQRPAEETQAAVSDQQPDTHYVLNTSSKKFHEPDCRNAKQISEKNRKDYYGSRDELLDQGYDPCGNCHP